MLRLFFRHSLRYFARHRLLTALNICGIALGVAVFVSVQIVNQSALQSFRASVDIVAGRATLEVVGDGVPFDEKIYPLVRLNPAISVATPLVENVALLADFPGEYLQVLGVDVFSNEPFRTFALQGSPAGSTPGVDFIQDPHVIALTDPLLQRLHLHPGEIIRVRARDGIREFRIGFRLTFSDDTPGADEHLAVMDIANAQESFGSPGKINRIDARFREGVDATQVIVDLQRQIPANVFVQAPDRRGQQIEKMIGSFQLNLTALSLVSLLVGMFLIYNTVAAAVVRRRIEIGILRSLGLSGGQVQALFLAEALTLGIVGLSLGTILGILLAGQLVSVVSHNITSLYILLSIQHLFISPWLLPAAAGLALGAVAAAAWFPSREAALVNPIEALSPGTLAAESHRKVGQWTTLGILLLTGALLSSWWSRSYAPAWLSFGAALLTLLGFAFGVPVCSVVAARYLHLPRIESRLALRHFGRSLHRNSVTIAALVTALAMLVGLSVMIFSFRHTVETWLNHSVRADVFISPAASLVVGHREILRPEVEALVQTLPEVRAVDAYRELRIRYQNAPVKLAVIRFPVTAQYNSLSFQSGNSAAILAAAAGQDQVVVSESFARKLHVATGDLLPLNTPDGLISFRVKGVFYDYTTDAGLILMDAATYARHWHDTGVNSLAVYLQPEVSAATLQFQLRPLLAPLGDYLIYSNRDLRQQVFRIFDQTFAVTYLLQTIGILISGLGTLLSLTILVAERRREIGIFRAIGASRTQVRIIVLIEAGLIGAIGSGLGLVAGLVLSVVLTNVINVAFFGWTIDLALPWSFLLTMPLFVVFTAIASGWFPAQKAAHLDIANAVKME